MGTIGSAPRDHSGNGDLSPSNPGVSKAGYILLLACCVIIMGQAILLLLCRVQHVESRTTVMELKTLLYSMIASLPFAMIRVAYMVAYAFDPSQDLNPEVGDFIIVFFVAFLMPLFAVIPLVLGGVLTRKINVESCGDDDEQRGLREEIIEPKPEHEEREMRRAEFGYIRG
jgi:hypothetical protein